MVPLAANIKAECLPFVGTVEIPQNLGFLGPQSHLFTSLIQQAGWTPPEPYCAFTACAMIREAYRKANVARPPQLAVNGSTSGLARTALAHGVLSPYAAAGALALMKGGDTGWHHTEIVLDVDEPAGTMTTFGANTVNPAGVQGVWIHTRNIADFDFVLS